MTSTKTCLQLFPAGNSWQKKRRPHVTDGPTAGGYAPCHHCGVEIYVGQGELSPAAGQRREHLAALADRRQS